MLDVLSQHVGAWIIVLMSHERYKAMNNPYEYNSKYQRKTGYLLAFLWISGALVSAPMAIFTNGVETPIGSNRTLLHCGSTWDPNWQSIYFSSLAIAECFVPVCFMIFYYIGVFKGYLNQTRLLNTSKPYWHIGRLNFQSVRDTLKILQVFFWFRSHCYHAEWIKQLSECSLGLLDELTRFLHSAWTSWRNRRNIIDDFNSFFYWLAILNWLFRFFGKNVKKFLEF